MVISPFLPWLQGYIVGLKFSESTGLQIGGGELGLFLIVLGLIGVVGSLFGKKASRKSGFFDVVIGIVALLEVGYVMSFFANLFTPSPETPNVIFDIGSGVYLAIAGALLVVIAGLTTVAKTSSTRRPLKASTAQAKPSTGLRGSFPLDEATINEEVGTRSPGVYALGRKQNKTLHVRYFGRSDSDLNAQLKKHIGQYDSFKFDYSDTPEAAFTKECELYHDFRGPEGKLDNKNHPERPQGMMWLCQKCGVYSSQVAPQPTASTSKRFCVKCGAELPPASEFCNKCDAKQTG
jgi:ribosomal protein L40E